MFCIEGIELPAIEDRALGDDHAAVLAMLYERSYYLGSLLIGEVEVILARKVRFSLGGIRRAIEHYPE